ncbi:MAG: hypothetical protein J3Q66DRAFT_165459 [Benniella sp.]|nr:MAG: hypothetical protein J3Q66DRAFT_165459 [Benniella sp.]
MSTSNSNSVQGKGYSGIKGLSFLKTHHQPSQGSGAGLFSANIDSTSPTHQTKNPLKFSSKTKANKHDHTASGYPSAQSQPSGIASFNAIIRSQAIGDIGDQRIMLEEWLQKRSGSLQMGWKRRWCVLRDDCLYYYRSNTDTKPMGVLHLADFSILTSGQELSKKSKFAFRLSSPEPIPNEDRHHLFVAETPQAFELWLEAVQGHINHAMARLESLGPLDTLDNRNGIFGSAFQGYNSVQPVESEQSVIDKVLNRLQLDDPTLSDINDPSTLIMPAQDHTTFIQHQLPKPPGKQRPDLDDDFDGWSLSTRTTTSSPTSGSNNSSSNSTASPDHLHYSQQQSSNTGLAKSSVDPLNTQRGPIVIRGGVHHSVPNNNSTPSGSYSQSTTSSFTEPHSNYSSSTEISFNGQGASGGKTNRGSFHTLEYQGRSGIQSRGSHSASSSVAGYSPQHPFRSHGPPFAIETSGFSLSGSTANSPHASPKIIALSGSSGYAVPPSPRTLFYKLDSNVSSLEHKESNASSTSISSIDSDSDEPNGINDAKFDRGLAAARDGCPSKFESRNYGTSGCNRTNSSCGKGIGSSSGGAFFGRKSTMIQNKNYSTENDHFVEEGKTTVMASDKKSKKQWSMHEGDGGGSEKSSPSSSEKPGNKTKKGLSQSLDTENPMFKGLVLISSPTKKPVSGSNISNNGKGFSKSMVSLAKGSQDLDSSAYPIQHVPSASSSRLFGTGARSHSVSVLDETIVQTPHKSSPRDPASYHPTVGDILSSRPPGLSRHCSDYQLQSQGFNKQQFVPSLSSSIPPKMATAPIAMTSDWSSFVQNKSQEPLELQSQHNKQWSISKMSSSDVGVNVSRHIVAPDKLTMAIDREIEERRQQQDLERSERPLGTGKKPTLAMEPTLAPVTILTVPGSVAPLAVLTSVNESNKNGERQDEPSGTTSTVPLDLSEPSASLSLGREKTVEQEKDVNRYTTQAAPATLVVNVDVDDITGSSRSPGSPTSPVTSPVPPSVPKRSPFRSAPILI